MFRPNVAQVGVASLGVALLVCVGCGGSSSEGPSDGKFSSRVPGAQQLGTISDQEENQLCSELMTYETSPQGQQHNLAACQLSAVYGASHANVATEADLQGVCKSNYDVCIAELSASAMQTCTKPAASCTATVADVEACVNDSAAYYADWTSFGRFLPSCATLTFAELSQFPFYTTTGRSGTETMLKEAKQGWQATPIPSCITYNSKCPQ